MMQEAGLTFAPSRDDRALWRDYRQQRMMTGTRVGAGQFSPRALRYAIPIATAMWLSAAILLHGYL